MMARQHKMAFLTWAIVYPLITGLLVLLEPFLSPVPLPIRTLILTMMMVPTLVYVAMPFATRLFGWWLETSPQCDVAETVKGSRNEY